MLKLAFLTFIAALELWNDDNFPDLKDSHSPFIALFTSDSCGTRCRDLETNLTSFAPKLQQNLNGLKLVKLDIHQSRQTAEKLRIEGVPSLLLVKPSHVHEYGGPIEYDFFQSWIAKRIQYPLTHLKSKEDVTEFVRDRDTAIVAFLPESKKEEFIKLIEPLREIPAYGWVEVNKDEKPFVELHKWGMKKVMKAEMDSHLQRWIFDHQLPLFGPITLSNLHAYLHHPRPFIWFVGSQSDYKKIKESLKSVITDKKLRDSFWWAWIDPDGGVQSQEFIAESLLPLSIPGIVLTDLDGPGRFRVDFDVMKATPDKVKQWIQYVLDEKVDRLLLSEDKPVEDKKAGVHKMVTNTLKETLMDDKRNFDLFLIQSSSWCTSCPKLIMSAMKLANSISDDCVKFAVMDSQKNELHPHWDINVTSAVFFPSNKLTNSSDNSKKDKVARLLKIDWPEKEGEEDPDITPDTLLHFIEQHASCRKLKGTQKDNMTTNTKSSAKAAGEL